MVINRGGIDMMCEICKIRKANDNVVTCSKKCSDVRILIIRTVNEFAPCNGCDNCWGDLGAGCTQQCREEFARARKLTNILFELARINLYQD